MDLKRKALMVFEELHNLILSNSQMGSQNETE